MLFENPRLFKERIKLSGRDVYGDIAHAIYLDVTRASAPLFPHAVP